MTIDKIFEQYEYCIMKEEDKTEQKTILLNMSKLLKEYTNNKKFDMNTYLKCNEIYLNCLDYIFDKNRLRVI